MCKTSDQLDRDSERWQRATELFDFLMNSSDCTYYQREYEVVERDAMEMARQRTRNKFISRLRQVV